MHRPAGGRMRPPGAGRMRPALKHTSKASAASPRRSTFADRRPIGHLVSLHLIDRELAGPEAGEAVLVARQPILDQHETLRGYELLHRPLLAAAPIKDPEAATARVIVAALADIGLERL